MINIYWRSFRWRMSMRMKNKEAAMINPPKANRELQEVCRKAKAWDNYISDVRERVRFTENTEDDIENETQKVIDYYMEDE